jgi:hypothetical protein
MVARDCQGSVLGVELCRHGTGVPTNNSVPTNSVPTNSVPTNSVPTNSVAEQ